MTAGDDRAAGGHPGLLPGRCLGKYAAEVVAARWDSVIFDVGRESLVRVPMMEPERGTKRHVGALFDTWRERQGPARGDHQPVIDAQHPSG